MNGEKTGHQTRQHNFYSSFFHRAMLFSAVIGDMSWCKEMTALLIAAAYAFSLEENSPDLK